MYWCDANAELLKNKSHTPQAPQRRNTTQLIAMGNDSHIDFDTCTLHGVLRQIRYVKQDIEEENPLLLKCHVTTFPTIQTKMMVTYLKSFPHDKFPSIKRFQKLSSDHTKLRAVICPTDYKSQEDINADLTALFKSSALFTLEELDIPCALPKSKEMAIKWSDKFWPMAWKGNPNHQFLKSLNLDPQMERQMITQLLDSYRLINNKSPAIVRSVTIIARETKDGMIKMLHVAEDNRQTHPLSHSVMNAIKAVADAEIQRRETETSCKTINQYLCLNMVVYTTHEPCVMCCMALVHSRIDRLVYIKDSPLCGGLASNYQLGDRDGLNWKFQIWKWIGDEYNHIDPILGVNV